MEILDKNKNKNLRLRHHWKIRTLRFKSIFLVRIKKCKCNHFFNKVKKRIHSERRRQGQGINSSVTNNPIIEKPVNLYTIGSLVFKGVRTEDYTNFNADAKN